MTSLAVLFATSWAYAGCEEPSTNSDITGELDTALDAYGNLDISGFRGSVSSALSDVPCLAEVLEKNNAARLHRVAGLIAFSDRDIDLAEKSFAAARILQPGFAFPESFIPPGNPVLIHYNSIDLSKVAVLPVDAPAKGKVWLDGTLATKRREGLPLFFQREDANGTITTSSLLLPGAQFPVYDAAKPPKAPKAPKSPKSHRTNKPMAILAGALAAGSLGAAAGSFGLKSSICNGSPLGPNCDSRDAAIPPKGTIAGVQALTITSVILGVSSLSFGTGALLNGTK